MATSKSTSCSSCSASPTACKLKGSKQISAYYDMMIALSLIHLALLASFETLPFDNLID